MPATLGASLLPDGRTRFRVWAPRVPLVEVHIHSPRERSVPMQPCDRGYFEAVVEDAGPGTLYTYFLDREKDRPDPASRFQPQGVHGPSQVVDPSFAWDDGWFGLSLERYISYEIHTGTFTTDGTFSAVIQYLDYLRDLGITAIELMPVAQFPGKRNWGYDGAYPFAVQNSYGGPEALKTLVNACHRQGLAVVLDVVYNHLGPEGNYLADFGPYFTDTYKTPWGPAINFDDAWSDEVRAFFIENALYWISEFHFDALRIDAVHAILDRSGQPFLQQLGEAVHRRAEELNRRVYVVPESDLNDTRLIRPRELGGFGLDAQWSDDFHHEVHVLLTGEQDGYYQDFGSLRGLAKAFREGFVYSGQYSRYRRRRHGNPSRDLPGSKFVVFAQNHDQVGNRMFGERLSRLVSFEDLKLAAGVVLLAPSLPLLFMGEEYGETAPFLYFVDHSDPALVEAVRRGRREEFAEFEWRGDIPDPSAEQTFECSKLNHRLRSEEKHGALWRFYRELIRLRNTLPALARLTRETLEVTAFEKEKVLFVRRWVDERQPAHDVFMAFHFGDSPVSIGLPVAFGCWDKQLDSTEKRWHANGSSIAGRVLSEGEVHLTLDAKSLVLFVRSMET